MIKSNLNKKETVLKLRISNSSKLEFKEACKYRKQTISEVLSGYIQKEIKNYQRQGKLYEDR